MAIGLLTIILISIFIGSIIKGVLDMKKNYSCQAIALGNIFLLLFLIGKNYLKYLK
jgi:hypothetical protein